jgi:hypothetical protein
VTNVIITLIVWLGTLGALSSVGVYVLAMAWKTNWVGRLLVTKDSLIAVVLGYVAIRRTLSTPAPPPDHLGLISILIYGAVAAIEIATTVVFARIVIRGR